MMPCWRVFRLDSVYFFTFDNLAPFSSIAMHKTGACLSTYFTFVPKSEIWGLRSLWIQGRKVRVGHLDGSRSVQPASAAQGAEITCSAVAQSVLAWVGVS